MAMQKSVITKEKKSKEDEQTSAEYVQLIAVRKQNVG